MIISHKHKFIFLKTRKTAGTSVEAFLAKFCGPNDILAISKDVTQNSGLSKRNITRSIFSLKKYGLRSYSIKLYKSTSRLLNLNWSDLNKYSFKPIFTQHMTVRLICEAIRSEVWNNYYKFTIERNPYDRLVSFYLWRKYRYGFDYSFKEFVTGILDKDDTSVPGSHGFSNKPFYLDNSCNICVDSIIQFENLQEDLNQVLKDIGINPTRINLPHYKSKIRDKGNYQDYYDDYTLSIAREAFKLEEKLFGYEF